MHNLHIGLLLHFYQPWWQKHFPMTLNKIANQCYRPILRLLNEVDGFCFTANINLSLLELLRKDYPDVLEGFAQAMAKGKIELVGSPAQHPIMPLIPELVQRAHIEDDENSKPGFNLKRNSGGFYLPELAFSAQNISLISEHGYRWTVIDDEPYCAVHGSVPFDYIVAANGFKLFLRSRKWSNRISMGCPYFDDIKFGMEHEIPPWTKGHPAYLVVATDAETFGHHHEKQIERFLEPMLKEWAGKSIVPLELLSQQFPQRRAPYLPDGSWSTSAHDVSINDPFPLWKSRFNVYHYWLWELVELGLNHFDQARQDCLEMTSSCHWWWISGRPWWEPGFMKLGAEKAFNVVMSYGSSDEIKKAENLYQKLRNLH